MKDSKEEEKDWLYTSLEGLLATVKKDDWLVLMGDMNGRMGIDLKTCMGRSDRETMVRRHRMTMAGDFLGPLLLMA